MPYERAHAALERLELKCLRNQSSSVNEARTVNVVIVSLPSSCGKHLHGSSCLPALRTAIATATALLLLSLSSRLRLSPVLKIACA